MTLSFHFLNVGHGSSVVVEYEHADGRSFGVIDSRCSAQEEPRALEKLRQLSADRLSFICLTHPHLDHYSGLFRIISAFAGRIDAFLSYSIGEHLKHKKALKSLAQTLRKLDQNTDDLEIRYGAYELCKILQWADNIGDAWLPCDGVENGLAPNGFVGVDVTTIQPPKLAKGLVLQQIRDEDVSLLGGLYLNDLSLALEFSYAGRTIVVGGDATEKNWLWRSLRHEQRKNVSIDADIANLPHHGSIHDCTPSVLDQLFKSEAISRRKIAVTSGDGQHQPHIETINWLAAHAVEPFCTNLHPVCGARTINLLQTPNLDPLLARWVREVSDDKGHIQPCQGDVTVTIRPDGSFEVIPQFDAPCAFRGDYDRLFS